MQINGGYNVLDANPGINLVQSGSLVLTDRISGSTRERAGLFIGDASGSQTFRVTNLGSNNSYDDAELVLTGSAVISGSTVITGSVQVDGNLTIGDDYDLYIGDEERVNFRQGSTSNFASIGAATLSSKKHLLIGGGTGTSTTILRLYETTEAVFFENSGVSDTLLRDFRVEGKNDTHLLFTTGSTARVGIGTSTPQEKLHVEGNISSSGYIKSQNNFVVSRSSAFTDNEFLVADGAGGVTSTDALAVDSAGNLGIGTPNPEVRLHMLGEAAQTTQILMEQFNDTADAPDIRTRRYRGTSASRADVQAGDYLFRLNVHGQDGGSSELYGSMQYDVSSTDQDACVWRIQTRDEGGTNATRLTIDKAGDATFAGDLAINGISNVSASIASAAGSGGGITQIDVGTGLDVVNNTGPTTTVNLDLTEVINTDGDNRVLTSDGDGTLTAERAVTISGGLLQFNDGDGQSGTFGIYTDLVSDVEGLTTIFVGDIAEIGPTPGSARTRGKVYNLNGTWGEARSAAAANCTGLLAIATNNSADTEWLLRGYVTLQASTLFNGTFSNIGQVFYIDPSNSGEFTFNAPSTTGQFVRACGHVVESITSGRTVYYKIYFNPSPDFIEN